MWSGCSQGFNKKLRCWCSTLYWVVGGLNYTHPPKLWFRIHKSCWENKPFLWKILYYPKRNKQRRFLTLNRWNLWVRKETNYFIMIFLKLLVKLLLYWNFKSINVSYQRFLKKLIILQNISENLLYKFRYESTLSWTSFRLQNERVMVLPVSL